MCLITYAPKGRESLDIEALHTSRQSNNDGYGLAWYKEQTGRWNVAKSMRSGSLEKVLARIPGAAPMVIHQRFATHGSKTLDNAHPFLVRGGVLVFHNGVISGTRADSRYETDEIGADGKAVYREPHFSDTRAYVEDELAPIIEAAGTTWLSHSRGIAALESRVGLSNVLTICVPDNPVPAIVNEARGTWREDLFYSNTYSIMSYARPYGRINYGSPYADGYGWDWENEYDFYKKEAAGKANNVLYLPSPEEVDGYEQKPAWMDEDEWARWPDSLRNKRR